MKIAIIGAGLAGLSCAHELERYGINPVVFEDLDFIGDREPHVSANVSVADRPIKDLLEYYRETCHMDIKPVNFINKLTHYSPGKKTVVKGKTLGYFFKRGKESDSLKRQIYSQLSNTKIEFGQKPDYKKLVKDYDYVVVANGYPDITRELGCWNDLISGWVKGAVVEGDFDPNELVMWIDHKYCRNGYAYLCPYDNKRASLALFVPLVNEREAEYYWKQFLSIGVMGYDLIEEFAVEHFSGFVNPHRIGSIYIAGGAGGAVSPLLGFGQVNSISMGVFAAQSIIEGLDYETLLKPVVVKEKAFYEIRGFFDNLTDRGFDNLLTIIGLPGIKQLIYHTNLDVIKLYANTLKIKNKLKNRK